MRKIVIATLVSAGVALAGMAVGSAAPVNNAVLKQAETMTTPLIKVQYYHRHRCHGYYSHWHWC